MHDDNGKHENVLRSAVSYSQKYRVQSQEQVPAIREELWETLHKFYRLEGADRTV